MKKLIALVIILVLAISLCACGSKQESKPVNSSVTNSTSNPRNTVEDSNKTDGNSENASEVEEDTEIIEVEPVKQIDPHTITSSELFSKIQENKSDNYKMKCTIAMNMTFPDEETNEIYNILVSVTEDCEIFGENVKGTMTTVSTFEDESATEVMDLYLYDGYMYIYYDEYGTWMKELIEGESIEFSSLSEEIVEEEAFANLEVTYNDVLQTYTVKLPGTKLNDIGLGDTGLDEEQNKALLDSAVITCIFDSDYRLKRIDLEGMKYQGPMYEDVEDAPLMDYEMTMDIEIYDYDTVSDIDVKVPEDALDTALTWEELYELTLGDEYSNLTS
jgi:hypothetical protein